MRLRLALLFVAANLFVANSSHGQSPYFQGKTMTIIVGTGAGDLYDLYARAIALFMGKYLPGNPNIIVQNMPGAGHMIAANYVYNIAKPDGLTMGAINAGLYFEQLIGRAEVKFDWTKYNWIGNATKSPQVLYMRADTPFKTIEDVRNAKEPPKCGTTGSSNMGYFVPKLLEETVSAKFNVISGYQGGNEIDLGVERGEISVPLAQHRSVFFPRAISYLAEERFFERAGSRRQSEDREARQRADDLRADGQIQNAGAGTTPGHRAARLGRISPPLHGAAEDTPGSGEDAARGV